MKVKDCSLGEIYAFPNGEVGMFLKTEWGVDCFDIVGRDYVSAGDGSRIRRATIREERDWYKAKFEGEY